MAERVPLMAAPQAATAVAGGASAEGGHGRMQGDRARGVQLLRENLRIMPTSVAGLALGVCGLGITWQTAAAYLIASQTIKEFADVISLLSINVGVTLLLLYMVKLAVEPAACVSDAKSLDGSTDLPCLSMAAMMVAWWLHVHGFSALGWTIWQVAVAAHCLLLMAFLRHVVPFSWSNVTPGGLAPPLGLAIAAGTGSALGAAEWVNAFFWISFAGFLVVFPAVLYRVHAHPTFLADKHQAQYPLLAAPPAVLLIAWIAMGGHQGHALTHFLFLVLMSSVVLVALRLPHLATLPFTPAGDIPCVCAVARYGYGYGYRYRYRYRYG